MLGHKCPYTAATCNKKIAGKRGRDYLLRVVIVVLVTGSSFAQSSSSPSPEGPTFDVPISNVTVPVGREAVLACVVGNLSTYKVAWLRVDTQTILTITNHVITKNYRIAITVNDHRTWRLHIRDVRESDRGFYMCQINTDPMKYQTGFLDIVVPPDIEDYPTSTDMVVREGSNVTLRCSATGSPKPNITWRREDGSLIQLMGQGREVASVEGPFYNITRVNRLHMGAYLCIASNGVPPSVSKRISLIVHFPPMISVPNQLVGARQGQEMTLECTSEAYPKSINYWTRENGEIITKGDKYEPVLHDKEYKVTMKLTIKYVSVNDYGSYKCISKNSLGDTDGSIKLYEIPNPTTPKQKSTTTPIPVVSKAVEKKQRTRQKTRPSPEISRPNEITGEIIDPSQPAANKDRDIRLRDRHEDSGGGGSEGSAPRDENTAQSMSSRSAAILGTVETLQAVVVLAMMSAVMT
ncbi:lachesin-like [Neodiprion pinetum]|uniref:lachesin-like n=1 Tax=Neodiprion pinetum TaxID=441929 RepID=UPI001ED90A7A|nr:lachesin-like isoform X1 [Neodiprion fabricii]XP_046477064.1 lachesin-like [Neodiprion pinetum]